MKNESNGRKRLTPLWRAVIEVAFIIFLFYSNLLMGEFTAKRAGQDPDVCAERYSYRDKLSDRCDFRDDWLCGFRNLAQEALTLERFRSVGTRLDPARRGS